jgi:hypothetical protein
VYFGSCDKNDAATVVTTMKPVQAVALEIIDAIGASVSGSGSLRLARVTKQPRI